MTFSKNLFDRFGNSHLASLSDADLLRAYAATRDEDSFRILIDRHGPMVLRVCRTVLRDADAADDAFQATFLVLSRKAARVAAARPGAVAGWLYLTARRVALKARTALARRLRREAAAVRPVAERPDDLTAREMLAVLDEEVENLPATYRMPLLLCFWQGLTQEEAARQLGVSPGSIKGRLERGRAKLAARLKKRGFAAPVLLLAPLAGVAVPGDLFAQAVGVSAGKISAPVAALARAATPNIGLRLAAAAAVVLVAVIGIGVILPKVTKPAPQTPAKPQADLNVDRFGDPLPAGAVARFGTLRFRADTWAENVALSPDRKTMAVVGWNSVLLWDLSTGREIRRLGPPPPRDFTNTIPSVRFTNIAYSPDGATLAVMTADGSEAPGGTKPSPVWLFDVASGRKLGELPGHGGGTRHLAFLKGGGSIITAGSDGAFVHDIGTGRELRRLAWAGGWLSSLAVSADRRYIFLAGPAEKSDDVPGMWEVWDAETGRLVHRESGLPPSRPAGAFSPDGKKLAVCVDIRTPNEDGAKAEIRLWDLAAAKEVNRWPGPTDRNGYRASIAFSPDGQFVATGGADHVVRQWSVETGKESRPAIHPYRHAGKVAYLDAATLMTHGAQNSVLFWDAATGKPERRFEGGETHLEALAVAPDGRTVAIGGGGGDATIRLWDTATGRQRLHISGDMYDVTSLAFAPDGKCVASADSHGTVTHWDSTSGRIRREMKGHKGWATSVAFSPDGRMIATGDQGNTVRLWDAGTGNELRKMTGTIPTAGVAALVFAPDGQTLFSAGWDHAIRQWDVAQGKALRVMQGGVGPRGADDTTGHTAPVTSLALSRDGRRLVSGSMDHTIRVWEVATGRMCRIVKAPNRDRSSSVRSVALSPDGSLLAAASEEHGRRSLIDVWDLNTGRQLAPWVGHMGQVTGLAFTPNGRRLASISTDTTGLLWDVDAIRASAPAADVTVSATLWSDLAGEPGPAYDAVRHGIAAGDRTVAVLSEKIKSVPVADAKRVSELLTALGSPRFAERDRASRDLSALGSAIEGDLRKALMDDRPAEVKARIKALLTDLESGDVRSVRAVEILEGIGTHAARRLLADLAAGAPGAKLTRDASESLSRLR